MAEQKTVTKLQRKIFQAAKEENLLKLHKYQEKLLESDSAKLLAVRKVTQDNRGKKTAGVDGIILLKPEDLLLMTKDIRMDGKASSESIYPETWYERKPHSFESKTGTSKTGHRTGMGI